jgi:hypothetical protein
MAIAIAAVTHGVVIVAEVGVVKGGKYPCILLSCDEIGEE